MAREAAIFFGTNKGRVFIHAQGPTVNFAVALLDKASNYLENTNLARGRQSLPRRRISAKGGNGAWAIMHYDCNARDIAGAQGFARKKTVNDLAAIVGKHTQVKWLPPLDLEPEHFEKLFHCDFEGHRRTLFK